MDILGAELNSAKLSTLSFFGGPFAYGSGSYGDDPPGRQWYSVSARVAIECQR